MPKPKLEKPSESLRRELDGYESELDALQRDTSRLYATLTVNQIYERLEQSRKLMADIKNCKRRLKNQLEKERREYEPS